MNDSNPAAPRTAGRRKFVLLVALFAAPLAIAYTLYFSGWRPQSLRVRGELLEPARPVGDASLRALDGQPASLGLLRGKWNLVYFGAAECLKPCRDNLYKMRQVVVSLGEDAERVNRVFIVTGSQALDALRYTVRDYPGTLTYTAARDELEKLARAFAVPAGSPLAGLHRVYLLDPLGNLVLSYAADADPSGMRKDLTRLLHVSRIG
jgi:cytochrome oxidase Cu insertion factor (SCO1/SenC/PrrC family)